MEEEEVGVVSSTFYIAYVSESKIILSIPHCAAFLILVVFIHVQDELEVLMGGGVEGGEVKVRGGGRIVCVC